MSFEILNQPFLKFRFAPYLLMAIMAVITMLVGGIMIFLLYLVGFEQQKARLGEMVYTQSEMIRVIARYDVESTASHAQARKQVLKHHEAVLQKVMHLSQAETGMGKSGEFVLAEAEGNRIHFLLSLRYQQMLGSDVIERTSGELAEPMRRALAGESGTAVLKDYRGEKVLASYRPIPELGWGLVAKIDMAEIRQPYLITGAYTFFGALLLIALGSSWFFRILRPIFLTLQENSEYNRLLFHHSPMGLALCRMDGKMVDVNPAFCAITGYTPEEMLEKSYWDITPAFYHPEELKRLEELDEGGIYGPYEKEYRHKAGHLVPVCLTGRVIVIGCERYIWSSVEDVSQRKKSESGLKQAALVFENTSEGIMITNAEREIVRVNPAFSGITGYEAEAVMGKDPRFLQSGRHDSAFYEAMWQDIDTLGQWRGEIWNRRKDGSLFPALQSITAVTNAKNGIESYVSVFTDITEQKAYMEQLAHLANHDQLTGVANRMQFESLFSQTLEWAKRNQTRFALLFLDLNRFKQINDTLGHDVGDLLLQSVAERLGSGLRSEDSIARLGGDEFTIILSKVTHPADAELVAKKLIERVSKPLKAGSETIYPEVSIGISIYPDHGENYETLLKKADSAMYRAKSEGKGIYVLHRD